MSNFLDFSIQTREQFKQWILTSLGHPMIIVELADENLEVAINDSIEYFTKYAIQDEDYIALPLTGYVENVGFTLPDTVTGVFSLEDINVGGAGDVNRLFTVGNAMLNSGFISIPINTAGYGWLNWHMFQSNIDMIRRMLGGGFQFHYNERTKKLKLNPDPVKESMNIGDNAIVCGVNMIRADELNYGEEWCKRYALARSKEMLGRIRGKYSNTQMLAGGTLDKEMLQEGLTDQKDLIEELRDHQGPFRFYVG